MRIYVGGSLYEVPREPELCRQFAAALGVEIVRRGHVLLNGCRSSLDLEVVTAAHGWLTANGRKPKDQILGYCLKSDKPVHALGTIRNSALEDWNMNHPQLVAPEQIAQADATIFVAGGEGTYWSKNWAEFARKRILGVPRFGGAAEAIYNHELDELRAGPSAFADEYEGLNSLSEDIAAYAQDVVSIAARMVTPRNVFAIMSFEREFLDVFASYREVCKEFDFVAERTDKSVSLERIVPRIEAGIQTSAFVIADVSKPSPNVFYEVGYAKGLGKDVIITAKQGTDLEFDVGDMPTIFWKIQEDLKDGLRKCLKGVVAKYGR